jgi:Protein of unknown function (DUF1485).
VRRTREIADTTLVGGYSPRRPVGGSSGSWVTEAAFEKYADGIADGMAAVDGLDAVYLSLHGAMRSTASRSRRPRPSGGSGRPSATVRST